MVKRFLTGTTVFLVFVGVVYAGGNTGPGRYSQEKAAPHLRLVSGGNPWALPVPERMRPAPAPVYPESPEAPGRERPRYITPEELKALDRLPVEQRYYRPYWMLPQYPGGQGTMKAPEGDDKTQTNYPIPGYNYGGGLHNPYGVYPGLPGGSYGVAPFLY